MNNDKKFEHEIDPDLLAEIEEWEKADHDEPAEYYFSNPDPYLKPQPLSPDHPRHNCCFNEDGHLCVKNLSAFWLPEFTLQKEIGLYRDVWFSPFVVRLLSGQHPHSGVPFAAR